MKWFLLVLASLSLGACSTISQIKEDGGYWCSEEVNYLTDLQLADKGATFTPFEYSDVLLGDYTNVESHGYRFISQVGMKNQGLQAKNVSIRMLLEVNGIEEKPIDVGICSSELELCIKQADPIFRYILPPESFFRIAFNYDRFSKDVTTIKQTLLIGEGESEPSDVIVSRNLTRDRYTLNCIFGSGTANPP